MGSWRVQPIQVIGLSISEHCDQREVVINVKLVHCRNIWRWIPYIIFSLHVVFLLLTLIGVAGPTIERLRMHGITIASGQIQRLSVSAVTDVKLVHAGRPCSLI